MLPTQVAELLVPNGGGGVGGGAGMERCLVPVSSLWPVTARGAAMAREAPNRTLCDE